jgi:uncharacterized protein YdcH (DUF465 family)
MSHREALKAELLRTHELFQKLHAEHQQCEARLAQLLQRSLPSPEDEVEEKRLKIRKLALKDQMEAILREVERASVPTSR